METDKLEEMPEELMEYFCEQVLKRDWPNSVSVYNYIKNAFQWKRKNSETICKLLYIPDDVENGTFIGIISRPEKGYCDFIIIYTAPGNEERFRRVMCCTEYIKWQNRPIFLGIPYNLTNVVKSEIEERGFVANIDDNWLYSLAADEGARLNYEVPEDCFIDRLTLDHIDLIHSLWAHKEHFPASELRDTLKLNFGLGVFNRKNDNAELIAWAMFGGHGSLGNLYVRPEYRTRGFGKLIAKAVSKRMGLEGVSPHAFVIDGNLASMGVFQSIGFVKHPKLLLSILVE